MLGLDLKPVGLVEWSINYRLSIINYQTSAETTTTTTTTYIVTTQQQQ